MINTRSLAQATAILLIAQFQMGACSRSQSEREHAESVYDERTGKLQLVKYDADGDGRPESWTYVDGSRILRTEIDTNRDGRIDRWQYYDENRRATKIGLSTKSDGREDRWVYLAPDGTTNRVESSPGRDGKVGRVEHFDKGVMSRAEEDSDGDSRIDKWETYDGTRLAVVAFDTQHRGSPDRRLLYDADGNVRIEVDVRGDGRFVPSDERTGANANRKRP